MAHQTASNPPLRLWPGVVIVLVQWVGRFLVPALWPALMVYGVLTGLGAGAAVLIWWLFFSRAPWLERIGALVLMGVAMAATWPFLDVSISTGAMGALYPMLAMPGLCLAFVAAAAVGRQMTPTGRRSILAVVIVIAAGFWALVRTGGFTGDFNNDLAWRWTPTPEERLLAAAPLANSAAPDASGISAAPAAGDASTMSLAASAGSSTTPEPETITSAAASAPAAGINATLDWPGFRGRDRDGVVHGVRIATDWSASPPKEMWRRPIGPGWSSFSVRGDVFYTQEQRGDDEIVAAYRVSTGALVWQHRDPARFWESNGGPGPRGTPTLGNGRVYSFGATGILNALDIANGRVIWTRNVSTDSGVKIPVWGFASSPLLFNNLVIVAAEGKLVAYDLNTGDPRWSGPNGGAGYSSPHLMTVGGVPQIVLLNGGGATSLSPTDGKLLWEHQWTSSAMSAPIVQPASTVDGDMLLSEGSSSGMRRVAAANKDGQWTVDERWTTTGLKPYFNDFVVHKGHAFGFDGSILSCIDVADGKRTWKGGRYGGGQLVLLADQDLLLVVSEEGELALVSAATDKFTELARRPALEGKTWNHPVVVGDVLLVRNGEEMAAFRLAPAKP